MFKSSFDHIAIKFHIVCFISFLFSTQGFGQPLDTVFVPKSKEQRELVRLTKTIVSASVIGDSAVLKRYIDDHFLLTFSSCDSVGYGKFMTKAQVITIWGKKPTQSSMPPTSTPIIHQVSVSNNSAVVHVYVVDKGLDKEGKPSTSHSWVTNFWIKKKTQWQLFSSHESFLKSP